MKFRKFVDGRAARYIVTSALVLSPLAAVTAPEMAHLIVNAEGIPAQDYDWGGMMKLGMAISTATQTADGAPYVENTIEGPSHIVLPPVLRGIGELKKG